MKIRRSRRAPILVAAAVAAGIATASFAFTASNTVPASKAGDGLGAISGYELSSVDYSLNSTDPTKIDAVAFTLDSTPIAGSTVKAKLVSSGSTWYTCTFSGTSASCATTSPQATVQSANELRVVIAD